jgi:hypothetical protein
MEQIKQTSIEWVLQYLNNVKPNEFCSIEKIKEVLEQAKEMEKEQIADKWQEGYDACEFHNDYENLQTKPINNPYK